MLFFLAILNDHLTVVPVHLLFILLAQNALHALRIQVDDSADLLPDTDDLT